MLKFYLIVNHFSVFYFLKVYYAEYFINQGLFELMYFKDSSISHKQQYRWYNVVYQLTVFISRSSIYWISIKYLAIFPLLQLINVAICLLQIYYGFIHSIWILFLGYRNAKNRETNMGYDWTSRLFLLFDYGIPFNTLFR